MKRKANIRTKFWTIIQSLSASPWARSAPSPGIDKAASTAIAPESKFPNCNPEIVTTGIRAFFKTCLLITVYYL